MADCDYRFEGDTGGAGTGGGVPRLSSSCCCHLEPLNGAGVPILVFADGRKGPVFLSIALVMVELLAVGCIDAKSVSGGVCNTDQEIPEKKD